ncbi:S8 family peptidase [Myroides sp. LJL119]
MRLIKPIYLSATLALALASCGSTKNLTFTPTPDMENLSKKQIPLSVEDFNRWSHLDIQKDSVPGMSVDKAYELLLNNKPIPAKIIVGVIDSGVEIDHDDLKNHIWTNPKEIAGNNIDDDNNGYVDDIHGWNFLGDAVHENVELTRIVRRGDDGSEQYKRAFEEYTTERNKALETKVRAQMLQRANLRLAEYLDKQNYTLEDLENISETAPQEIIQAKEKIEKVLKDGRSLNWVANYEKSVEGKLNHHYNKDFDGRSIVGDNPTDINDRIYGNNNVIGPDRDQAAHGTHVSGIIAQTRGNDLGGDGVASDVVQIMTIRAVPDGDEYDKDIALGIRYAADNGAKVINGSFGKYYQENSQWVRDAIKYAESKDVLIVVAAGNDAKDLNVPGGIERYPNDNVAMGPEIADNFLVVGALAPELGEKMVASFSNYGHYDVDVFAPGVQIYATVPHNTYDKYSGTSMASPNTAGVAALIRAYYPEFTAAQVKKILKDSGVSIDQQVIVGKNKEVRNFKTISTSGSIVNAYNALLLAEQLAENKVLYKK